MVVWAASTITFFIPRISDVNPIRERFAELARLGGFAPGDLEKLLKHTTSIRSDKSFGSILRLQGGFYVLTLVSHSINFQKQY